MKLYLRHRFWGWKIRSKEEMDYLENIAKNPFMSATERDNQVGILAWKGSSIRTNLENKGLIKIHRLRTGKRGGKLSFDEVTDAGYEFLHLSKLSLTSCMAKEAFSIKPAKI